MDLARLTESVIGRLKVLEDLRLRAEAFPDRLDEARRRHVELQRTARNYEGRVKESEAEITALTLTVDGSGEQKTPSDRPGLKSETTRKAAIQRALLSNPAYQALVKELTKAESMAKSAGLDVDRLESEWRSIAGQIEILTAQANLLALITPEKEKA